jgi:CRP-like cAMP-binding protein
MKSAHGGRSILSFHHAGDFCCLYRYGLPEADSAVRVQALTDVEVAVIDGGDMERLLVQPELALAFWRMMMLEASICRERANKSRGSAIECVAHLLCGLLARREAVGIECARLRLSRDDVADATGLSAVQVNRAIQCLRRRNLLCKESSSIEVADRRQLAQVANFDGRYLDMPRLLSRWAVHVE